MNNYMKTKKYRKYFRVWLIDLYKKLELKNLILVSL